MAALLDGDELNRVLVKYASMDREEAVQKETLEIIEKEYIRKILQFVENIEKLQTPRTWTDKKEFEAFLKHLRNTRICLEHLKGFMSDYIKLNQDVNLRLIESYVPLVFKACGVVSNIAMDSMRHIVECKERNKKVEYKTAPDVLAQACGAATDLIQYLLKTRICDIYMETRTTGQSKDDLSNTLLTFEKDCLQICIEFTEKAETVLDVICFNSMPVSDDFNEFLACFSTTFRILTRLLCLLQLSLQHDHKRWNKMNDKYSEFFLRFQSTQTRMLHLVRQLRNHIRDVDGDLYSPKYTRKSKEFGIEVKSVIEKLNKRGRSEIKLHGDIDGVNHVCEMFVERVQAANRWSPSLVLADNFTSKNTSRVALESLVFCFFKTPEVKSLMKDLQNVSDMERDEKVLWCFQVDSKSHEFSYSDPISFDVPTCFKHDTRVTSVILRVRSNGKWTRMTEKENKIKLKETSIEFEVREADCILATYDFIGETLKVTRSGLLYTSKIDPRCTLEIPKDAVEQEGSIDVKFMAVDKNRLRNYCSHRPDVFANLIDVTDGVKVVHKSTSKFLKPATLRFPVSLGQQPEECPVIKVLSFEGDSFSVNDCEYWIRDNYIEVKVESFSISRAICYRPNKKKPKRRHKAVVKSRNKSSQTKRGNTRDANNTRGNDSPDTRDRAAQVPISSDASENCIISEMYQEAELILSEPPLATDFEGQSKTPDNEEDNEDIFKAAQVACGELSICKILTFYKIEGDVIHIRSEYVEITKAESRKQYIISNEDMILCERAGTSRDVDIREGASTDINISGEIMQSAEQPRDLLSFPFRKDLDCHVDFAVRCCDTTSNTHAFRYVGFINYTLSGKTQHSVPFVLLKDDTGVNLERDISEKKGNQEFLSEMFSELTKKEKLGFVDKLITGSRRKLDVSDINKYLRFVFGFIDQMKRDQVGPELMRCFLEIDREDLMSNLLQRLFSGEGD